MVRKGTRLLAASVVLVLVASACTSGATREATNDGTPTSASTASAAGTQTATPKASATTQVADEDSSGPVDGITDMEDNRATVSIVSQDSTVTDDFTGPADEVNCTTMGDDRDSAEVDLAFHSDGMDVSIFAKAAGAVPGTHPAELSVSTDELGIAREGEATLVLDRTVEIAGDYGGDLWLFEGSFSGSLTDEGPGAEVKGTFACIGHVSWSAAG